MISCDHRHISLPATIYSPSSLSSWLSQLSLTAWPSARTCSWHTRCSTVVPPLTPSPTIWLYHTTRSHTHLDITIAGMVCIISSTRLITRCNSGTCYTYVSGKRILMAPCDWNIISPPGVMVSVSVTSNVLYTGLTSGSSCSSSNSCSYCRWS